MLIDTLVLNLFECRKNPRPSGDLWSALLSQIPCIHQLHVCHNMLVLSCLISLAQLTLFQVPISAHENRVGVESRTCYQNWCVQSNLSISNCRMVTRTTRENKSFGILFLNGYSFTKSGFVFKMLLCQECL